MADFIKYRFPGGKIVEKIGYFSPCNIKDLHGGFFISTFEGDKIYEFKVNPKAKKSTHFFGKAPKVYSKEEYVGLATQFINQLKNTSIKKAIFSRIKEVDFDSKNSENLFSQLEIAYPNAFVYLLSGSEIGTWLGATPELLLKSNQNRFSTVSLASTKKVEDSSDWGIKEIFEQELVSTFIHSELEKMNVKELKKSETYEFVAGPVKHLKNDFSWIDTDFTLIETLKILHPTPAVSGFPRNEALKLIEQTESHDRELYAGMIGFFDSNQSEVYVNLRCCQILDSKLYLYLGGGFTQDSVIEDEWEETENKSQTLLKVIQKL